VYGLLPKPQARADGIEGRTELVIGYDARTHTFLISSTRFVDAGHWAEEFI
jgi:hypothetical protein